MQCPLRGNCVCSVSHSALELTPAIRSLSHYLQVSYFCCSEHLSQATHEQMDKCQGWNMPGLCSVPQICPRTPWCTSSSQGCCSEMINMIFQGHSVVTVWKLPANHLSKLVGYHGIIINLTKPAGDNETKNRKQKNDQIFAPETF